MTEHVLVVDDEPDFSSFMQASLEESGDYRVSAALGEEALSLLERDPPDLVILDNKIQGRDGIAIVLETLGHDIPLLMTDDTPRPTGHLEQEGLPLLCKPFLPAKLLAEVRRTIAATITFRRRARVAALTSQSIRHDAERVWTASVQLRHSALRLVERGLEVPARHGSKTAVIHAADAWAQAMAAIKEADDEPRFAAEYQIDLESAETELYCCVLKLRTAARY